MVELSFKHIYDDTRDAPMCRSYMQLLALHAIELLSIVEPSRVDEYSGYFYAINHGEVLNVGTHGWAGYASRKHKEITEETTFCCLDMITRLLEPFDKALYSPTNQVFTSVLPKDIIRILTNEDLTDPMVIGNLNLAIKGVQYSRKLNACMDEREDTREHDRLGAGTTINILKVIDYFKPLIDSCNFKNMATPALLKKYTAIEIHRIASWLSCLYHLFDSASFSGYGDIWEHYDAMYHDQFDIRKALSVPVATPETVLCITKFQSFNYPPLQANRSDYLSLSERYLVLLSAYWTRVIERMRAEANREDIPEDVAVARS